MRQRTFVIASVLVSVLGVVAACSSNDARPPASAQDGGTSSSGGFDANFDSGDASYPASCKNTVKDENETDVDCGGKCAPCPLGKACGTDPDCESPAKCTNKLCAICDDGKTNGDETDVDCGGKACGPCTVGKRCKAPTDCKSEACDEDTCACPVGMTIVARAGGGAYCVDTSEVTKGQYNKFITANVPVTDQVAICKPPANPTFVPRGAWPPATDPGGLAFNLGHPVHYVDWCDAYAYCKWAKKEMCGQINGGAIAIADVNDHTKDAWYNACSAQGTKSHPYGTSFDGTKCNGAGRPLAAMPPVPEGPGTFGFGYATNQDDNVYLSAGSDVSGNITGYANVACQGGSVELYQMSGNVAEWEDACDGTGTAANCRVRGGSYADADDGAKLACNAARSLPRLPDVGAGVDPLKDVGIRCCLY